MGWLGWSRVRITEHPKHFLQRTFPSVPGSGVGRAIPPGTGSKTHCSHVSHVSQVPKPGSSIRHAGFNAAASGCIGKGAASEGTNCLDKIATCAAKHRSQDTRPVLAVGRGTLRTREAAIAPKPPTKLAPKPRAKRCGTINVRRMRKERNESTFTSVDFRSCRVFIAIHSFRRAPPPAFPGTPRRFPGTAAVRVGPLRNTCQALAGG